MENVSKIVPEVGEQRIDLHAYWKIFWRKKFYLAVPLILSFVLSFVGVRYLTPIYESSTLLSVEEHNILASTMSRYIATPEERSREINQRYRALIETRLKSHTFLRQVVEGLGLHRSHELRQEIVQRINDRARQELTLDELIMRRMVSILKGKIKVQNPNLGFFTISLYDSDPTNAYVLATRVSEKFIEATRQAQLDGIRQAGAFSDEQLAIYKEKLEASEKELSRVQREMLESDIESNPITSGNVQFAEALLRTLKAQIERNEIALRMVRNRLVSVFGLVPSSEKVSSNETVRNIEKHLTAVGEKMLLSDLITEVEVAAEDETYPALWDELRQSISEIVNEEYSEFSSDLRPLISEYFYQRYVLDLNRFRERKLQSYINQFSDNIARRPLLDREFNKLKREVETNRAIHEAFIESKTSAQITEAVQSTNLGLRINIIERAEKPLIPVEPDKMQILLMAVLFGAACGIAAILVTEYMDDSFKAVDEVKRILKVPVLGTVPKTISSFAWEKKKRGKMILFWIMGLFFFISIVSGSLYMYARNLKETSFGIRITGNEHKR